MPAASHAARYVEPARSASTTIWSIAGRKATGRGMDQTWSVWIGVEPSPTEWNSVVPPQHFTRALRLFVDRLMTDAIESDA